MYALMLVVTAKAPNVSMGRRQQRHRKPLQEPQYILVLDLGSTFLKCTIFHLKQSTLSHSSSTSTVAAPESVGISRTATPAKKTAPAEHVEIDPGLLFQHILKLIEDALTEHNISWEDVITIGITSQRNTFLVYDAATGRELTNLVSWKDRRGDVIAESWNRTWLSRVVRFAGTAMSGLINWNRAIIMSAIYFRSGHILPRLSWIRKNMPDVEAAISTGSAKIVSLDSWTVARLTNDFDFLTDYSCISSWGFFSPASMRWSRPMLWSFGIPRSILPKIQPTASHFGRISEKFFGSLKPITAVVADQQASAFGHYLFRPGQCKITLGTGAFITANSGGRLIFDNEANIYTLVGWKTGAAEPAVYLTETLVAGYAETLTECSQRGVNLRLGIVDNLDEIDELLCRFLSSEEEELAVEGNIGQALDVFICLACMIVAQIKVLSQRVDLNFPLRVDGGLSNSTVLLRILATLLGEFIERPEDRETTSSGAAWLAGIGAGLWTLSDMKAHESHYRAECETELQTFLIISIKTKTVDEVPPEMPVCRGVRIR
ncbi:putative glycerol kinase 5 [Hypsibius exemplaris]|uniref:Glycerol kinase 5 n=1 Tax=Hypsibius exemplaris TaxID=2072580 RepID=A0A1W0X8H7_HYPEX|nr:putative glycerol kinase 5 [Hypsibius exemplaris]